MCIHIISAVENVYFYYFYFACLVVVYHLFSLIQARAWGHIWFWPNSALFGTTGPFRPILPPPQGLFLLLDRLGEPFETLWIFLVPSCGFFGTFGFDQTRPILAPQWPFGQRLKKKILEIFGKNRWTLYALKIEVLVKTSSNFVAYLRCKRSLTQILSWCQSIMTS